MDTQERGYMCTTKQNLLKPKLVAKYKHEPFALQSIREISLDREVLC